MNTSIPHPIETDFNHAFQAMSSGYHWLESMLLHASALLEAGGHVEISQWCTGRIEVIYQGNFATTRLLRNVDIYTIDQMVQRIVTQHNIDIIATYTFDLDPYGCEANPQEEDGFYEETF